MSIKTKIHLLFAIFLSLVLMFTFNNCGTNFSALKSEEQILHESLTLNKEIYINGTNENIFYTGRDLTFSADVQEPPQDAIYEWKYTVNDVAQGCNQVQSSTPSLYIINCPTVVGQLAVMLTVRSSSGILIAEPVVYNLTQQPATPPVVSNEVAFTIPVGTGNRSWNTVNNPIRARVGQRIVITNGDSVPHRMHTGGSPCPHGANILPGRTGVCVVNSVFNGSVYDHNNGTSARIYIVTTP